jgi:hypothetical protein
MKAARLLITGAWLPTEGPFAQRRQDVGRKGSLALASDLVALNNLVNSRAYPYRAALDK